MGFDASAFDSFDNKSSSAPADDAFPDAFSPSHADAFKNSSDFAFPESDEAFGGFGSPSSKANAPASGDPFAVTSSDPFSFPEDSFGSGPAFPTTTDANSGKAAGADFGFSDDFSFDNSKF